MSWNGGLVRGPMRWFVMAALAMILSVPMPGWAATGESLAGLAGTVGHNKVGMSLGLKGDSAITGGHYFYVHYLKDIPLDRLDPGRRGDVERGATAESFSCASREMAARAASL